MSNNFALMMRVRGDVSAERLGAALARIAPRHPALLLPAEAAAQPIDVRAGCADDDWIEVAGTDLRTDFPGWPGKGALARFTCLQHPGGFDLVACFHHGAADGISGVFVLRDLLQALADPQAVFEALPRPPWTHLLAPAAVLEHRGLRRRVALAAAGLRARASLQKLRRRLAPAQAAAQTPSARPADGPLPLNQQYVILPTRLTGEQTAALVARCKQEQVTVHAAQCVAWLRAFAGISKTRFGAVSSPVNLRERLARSAGETAGVLLATVETRLDCAPGRDFWQLAREFKHKLAHDMRDENLFFSPLLMADIFSHAKPGDIDILLGLLFFSPVKYDFSITNLGRVALPERCGDFQVETFYGPLVNSSEHERTVGVSTLGGQLGMVYTFRRSKMDPAQGQALLERVVALLIEAAQAPTA